MRASGWPSMSALCMFVAITACAGVPSSEQVAVGAAPVTADRYPEIAVDFPGDIIGRPDIVYARAPGYRPLTLDLYMPARARNEGYPLVLFVHGGAWQHGDSRHAGAVEDFPAWLAQLAESGFVVASINYRLSSEATFPAALMDAKIALRWLRHHASEYWIDRSRAIVWGVSAGGQIAGLMGLDCDDPALDPVQTGALATFRAEELSEESDCVQGVVMWYAPTDLNALSLQTVESDAALAPEARYLGCAPQSCPPELVARASPISFARRGAPPFLFIHGRADDVVSFAHSERLDSRLRSVGGRSELIAIDDVGHSFVGATPEATAAATRLALERTQAFMIASAAGAP